MRGWPASILLLSIVACSSDRTGPGNAPDVPASLSSTTLDGAIALTWSDNSYTADPANFEHYRVYSTSYDLGTTQCGSSWRLEGTTVAPEFLVGALTNGISRCFSVSAAGRDGAESARSEVRHDTPRPDARNVVLLPARNRTPAAAFDSGRMEMEIVWCRMANSGWSCPDRTHP